MKLIAFSRFFDRRGQALVELAFVLPLLVLILLGVFDFSRAIQAKNIITNVSREGANMVIRSTDSPQDIMNSLAYTAQPLDMRNDGMMYITVIEGVGSGNGKPKIQTQTPWANAAGSMKTIDSRIGKPGSDPHPNVNVPALVNLHLTDGQTAEVVEVFYRYQSIFGMNTGKLSNQYYSMAVF